MFALACHHVGSCLPPLPPQTESNHSTNVILEATHIQPCRQLLQLRQPLCINNLAFYLKTVHQLDDQSS
jgi:hypothetical protein